MTQRNKDKWLNVAISIIVPICVVFITMSLSSDAAEKKALKEAMDKKAEITYVNDRNSDQNKLIKANSDKIDNNYEKYEKKVDKIYDYILSLNAQKK